MWSAPNRPSDWPMVNRLSPVEVLDEYDGPRLFTILSTDGHLLLAYQCGEDESTERFLLVPADAVFVQQIKDNIVSIREALLSRCWAWLIDRNRDGTLSGLTAVYPNELPETALPRSGVRLRPEPHVFLRIRMVGESLSRTNVPASVVKRAVESSTGALRTLSRYALKELTALGRPTEELRGIYDLPAVAFEFKSFEIAFGYPRTEAELPIPELNTLEQVKTIMVRALDWATAPEETALPSGVESEAIINALTKLIPPTKGPVKEVELSGALVGTTGRKIKLTRKASERVGAARKRLKPDPGRRTFEGVPREFDKDKSSFILRDENQDDICFVSVPAELYEEAYYAFEEDLTVDIVVDETMPGRSGDLVSITPKKPPPPRS